MADLGELVLKLNIDDVGFNRDLERARARAASLQDISIGLRPDRSFGNTESRIDALQRRRIELTAQLDTGAQFARLEAEIEALNRRQIRLNVNTANIDAQIQKINGDIARLEARRIRLQADPNATAESIGRIDDQIRVLEARRLRLNLNQQEVASEIGQIEARLKGIDDERVNVNINAENARTEIAKIDRELSRAKLSVGDLGQTFTRLDAVVAGAVAGITNQLVQGITSAIGQGIDAIRGFGETSTQLAAEYRAQIAGLTSITGSLEAANAAYNEAGDVANRYGLQQNKVIGAYTQLTAAGAAQNIEIQTTNELFEALAKSLALTGASTEQQGRAFTAVSQVFSKGRVQAEELTGQLAEALPTGLGILAKGLNTTVPELLKFVSTGQFTAERFAEAFIRGSQGIQGAVNPTNVTLAQLSNAYLQFQIGVGQALVPLQTLFAGVFTDILSTLQEAGAAGVFAPFTDALAALSTTLGESPQLLQALSDAVVQAAATVVNTLGGAIQNLVTLLQTNPEGFIQSIQSAITSFTTGFITLSQVVGQAFSFIINNFDLIVNGVKAVGATIAAVFASSVVASIAAFVSSVVGIAGAVGGVITTIAGVLSAGGIPALVAAASTALTGLAAAAAPIVVGFAAIAAAVGVAVGAFKLLQNEQVQSFLAEVGNRARELFEAFRNTEPVQAALDVLRAIGEVIAAILPRIGQLIGFLGRLAAQGIQGLVQQFTNAESVTRQILANIIRYSPLLQGVLGLARLLANVFSVAARTTADILRNLANIIRGPQETEGGGGGRLAEGLSQQADAVGELGDRFKEAKQAADDLDGAAPEVAAAGDGGDFESPLEAEKERQALIEKTEKEIDDAKRARQEAFDDEKRARDLALEDEKLARQERFEALKRANALALEREVESVKVAAESRIEALKEEGRRRETAFKEQQRRDEEAFTAKQNADKLAFEEDLNRRRTAAERQFSLDEAGSLEEQNRLVEQFAREDRRAQVLAPFEQEERDFEARQLEERRAFEEGQRQAQAIFEEQQRALDAQAQQIKAASEAEIRALNLAAKEQELALERTFNANERDIARQSAEQERQRQRAFNAEERRRDEESARRIEQLKAGNNVQTVTPRRHGGPVVPGRTYLAGEAGPELLRMGGKESLITKPSLMRFDQPGRIYSAPQTRRRLSQGQLSKAGMGGDMKRMQRLLEAAIAKPRGDIQTTVQVQGINGDQVRRQLVRHQMDLYRGLGGL